MCFSGVAGHKTTQSSSVECGSGKLAWKSDLCCDIYFLVEHRTQRVAKENMLRDEAKKWLPYKTKQATSPSTQDLHTFLHTMCQAVRILCSPLRAPSAHLTKERRKREALSSTTEGQIRRLRCDPCSGEVSCHWTAKRFRRKLHSFEALRLSVKASRAKDFTKPSQTWQAPPRQKRVRIATSQSHWTSNTPGAPSQGESPSRLWLSARRTFKGDIIDRNTSTRPL